MSNKSILTALVLGLIIGGTGCWALSPADDKPPVKTPGPIRPLMPAKPQPNIKPGPTRALPTPAPTQLTTPMSTAAIQRALARKIDLDLTAVPLGDAVAAIARQTKLEIRIAPDALSPKDNDKTGSKTPEKPDLPSDLSPVENPATELPAPEKPAPDKSPDKGVDKPAAKPADKPPEKPDDKLTVKATDKATTKATAKATTEIVTEKSADVAAEPLVSAHLKDISAGSALDLVLRDIGLSWAIDHGGILVAPPDQLPATTDVYDVRDLVVAHPSFDTHDDSVELQYDPLISLITGVIQCPGWAGDVDKIQDCNPFHGTLTVHQDQQVQQKVAGLLAALRKARDLPVVEYAPSVNRGLSIVGADDSGVAIALDSTVEATFNGAKLEQVIDWIRNSCGIPVHLDAAVPATVQDGQSFTLKASGVSLRAMLNALLPQAHLAYTVTDETLLITTQDLAADFRSVRVYPVGDLIDGEVDAHGIDDDYAQLLDSITHNVQPDSWAALDRQKQSGSTGNAYAAYLPAGRAVVFDQTYAAHEEIAATLAKLRAAVASQPLTLSQPTDVSRMAAASQPAKRLAAGAKAAAKGSATESTKEAEQPKRYLSMRIYKLNPDLPADDFVAVVRDLVEPKSWTGEAYLHGVPGAIVVRQTPAIHKRIERLLIELGAIPDPKKSGNSGTPILIGAHKRT